MTQRERSVGVGVGYDPLRLEDLMTQRKHQQELRQVARGLEQGVDALLIGRHYRGTLASREESQDEEEDSDNKHLHIERTNCHGADDAETTKSKAEANPTFSAKKGGGPEKSLDSERQDGESNSDSQSDGDNSDVFLDFDAEDIRDTILEGDEWRLKQAEMAHKRAQRLFRQLKTNERIQLLGEVNTWFQSQYHEASRNLDHLKTQEDLRVELQRNFSEYSEEVHNATSKKEVAMLCKLNAFSNRLHDHQSQNDDKEPSHGNPNWPASLEITRNMERFAGIRVGARCLRSRANHLEEVITDLRRKLQAAQNDIKRTEREMTLDSVPKASELLQIIGDQQDMMAALNTRTVLLKKRVATLDGCAKVVKAAHDTATSRSPRHHRANVREARINSKRITAASTLVENPDDTISLINEIKDSLRQRMFHDRVKSDTRTATRLLERLKVKDSTLNDTRPNMMKGDMAQQFSDIDDECTAINDTINFLRMLRDSDDAPNTIISSMMDVAPQLTPRNAQVAPVGTNGLNGDTVANEKVVMPEVDPSSDHDRSDIECDRAPKLKVSKFQGETTVKNKEETQATQMSKLLSDAEKAVESLMQQKERLLGGRTLTSEEIAEANNSGAGADANGNGSANEGDKQAINRIPSAGSRVQDATARQRVPLARGAASSEIGDAAATAKPLEAGAESTTVVPPLAAGHTSPKSMASKKFNAKNKTKILANSLGNAPCGDPSMTGQGGVQDSAAPVLTLSSMAFGAQGALATDVAMCMESGEPGCGPIKVGADAAARLAAILDEEKDLAEEATRLEARIAEMQLQQRQPAEPPRKLHEMKANIRQESKGTQSKDTQAVGTTDDIKPSDLFSGGEEGADDIKPSDLFSGGEEAVDTVVVRTELPATDPEVTMRIAVLQERNTAWQSRVADLEERIATTKSQADRDEIALREAKRAAASRSKSTLRKGVSAVMLTTSGRPVKAKAGCHGATQKAAVVLDEPQATKEVDVGDFSHCLDVHDAGDSMHVGERDSGSPVDTPTSPRLSQPGVGIDDHSDAMPASPPSRDGEQAVSLQESSSKRRSRALSKARAAVAVLARASTSKKNIKNRERYENDVSEMYELHLQNTRIENEIASVELLIKCAKGKTHKDTAAAAVEMITQDAGKKVKNKEVPKIITDLRHRVSKQQHELSQLRNIWWQSHPTRQTKAVSAAASNRWDVLKEATISGTSQGGDGREAAAQLLAALRDGNDSGPGAASSRLFQLVQAARAKALDNEQAGWEGQDALGAGDAGPVMGDSPFPQMGVDATGANQSNNRFVGMGNAAEANARTAQQTAPQEVVPQEHEPDVSRFGGGFRRSIEQSPSAAWRSKC